MNPKPDITAESLALFVRFVRMNPRIPADSPLMPRVLRAYARIDPWPTDPRLAELMEGDRD